MWQMLYRWPLTAYGFLQFGAQVLWLGKWQMPKILKRGGEGRREQALHAAHRHVGTYLRTLDALDPRY